MSERAGRHHELEDEEKDKSAMGRRAFLGVIASAAVGLAGKKIFDKVPDAEPDTLSVIPEKMEIKIIDASKLPEAEPAPQGYDLTDLKGETFEDLFTYYTGIHGEVKQERYDIDFNLQLEKMWNEKNRVSRNSIEVSETGSRLRREYMEEKEGLMGLEEY